MFLKDMIQGILDEAFVDNMVDSKTHHYMGCSRIGTKKAEQVRVRVLVLAPEGKEGHCNILIFPWSKALANSMSKLRQHC